jgi:ribosomal protein S6--L-glutamate ligase
MLRVADRLACTVALASAGIPMPDTLVTEDLAEARRAIHRYGTAVLKPLFSTKGRGMRLLSAGDEASLTAELEAFRAEGNTFFYVQKKVPIPGQDLGVVFVGGSYVGTYARVRRAGSWSTTTANGGRYEPYSPPPHVIDVAHRAQLQFGLDFTGVDVVETDQGPLVFEVSAFGGFRGLREGLGMDPAGLYAEHVLRRIGEVP